MKLKDASSCFSGGIAAWTGSPRTFVQALSGVLSESGPAHVGPKAGS